MKVTLKNGSIIEVESGKTAYDVALSISEGLARNALIAKINGELEDLNNVLDSDCTLEILSFKDE